MLLCSWCVSDKATRSDDEDETKRASGSIKPQALPAPDPDGAKRLFDTYADSDDPDVMGPEGIQQMCSDAQIPVDGALPLLLVWQLGAKDMSAIARDEWVNGMNELGITNLPVLLAALSDLHDLLILRKPAPKRTGTERDAYKKDRYWTYAADVEAAFSKFYMYCYALANPNQVRNIDMQIALGFWPLILCPRYPIMVEIVEFINEKGTYKAANKDLWSLMLEFCRVVKPSLEGYDDEGAWPILLDNFVSWKREKIASKGTS